MCRFKKRPLARRSAWIDPKAIVPKSCVIGERVKIKGPVVLGENMFINDCVRMGSIIEIGEGTRIEPCSDICSCSVDGIDKKITIGKFVIIEPLCIINKGVIIGDRAILKAGSVVSIDVPAFAIVEGNPAKVIGWRKKENDFN